ncbi:hypothetical protein [Nocardia cerradoensis]|nr:hypothetical protein [Nocardia cerradoensis]NKY48181.1 hypothetical protein [Nocardia cerradoensis]
MVLRRGATVGFIAGRAVNSSVIGDMPWSAAVNPSKIDTSSAAMTQYF